MEIIKLHIFFFTAVLFIPFFGFSQQELSDSIYKHLDVFLEQPNAQNSQEFSNYITSLPEGKRDVSLAKTIAFCNLGYAEANKGAYQQAINFYERAKQLYFSKNLNGYDIIEYCLKPLGNLYIKTQALSEAENTIKHYIVLAQETRQSDQEISGILNLSVIYHNRGAFENALQLLRKGIQKAPNNQDLKLNMATNYFALNQKDEAKAILHEILNSNSRNANVQQLLAQIQLSEKDYKGAISTLNTALTIYQNSTEASSRELAKLHLALAETLLANNQNLNSIKELQQVYTLLIPSYKKEQNLPTVAQLYAETTLVDALDLQATLFKNLGETNKAINALELSFVINDYLSAQLYMQDSKLITQQNVKQRAEILMGLLFTKYEDTKDIKWFEKAIQLDSQIKGKVMAEALSLKKKLNSNFNAKTAEFQQLQTELATLGNQIQKHTQNSKIDYTKLVLLQKQYSTILTRQRILYDSIQNEMGLVSQPIEIFNLEDIKRKALVSNQTIVSYFVGAKTVYQFIISKEKIAFKKLVNSEIDFNDFLESIRSYNHFFNNPNTINNDIPLFAKTSLTLFKRLQLPKAENLIIIPDGILVFVPFQTLLTKKTQTFQYSEMPFLLFESKIAYAVSLRMYCKKTIPFEENQSVLGVFPVFKNTPQELSYSIFEAEAIANLFPTELLMESQASATAFIGKAKKHSILHISTHALGGTFSSDPSIQFYDRSLSIEELYGLNLKSQLVILSACDTGIGKVIKGEGALSLARSFQYAGASNILFSLWQVNDKSTAQLMEYYYQNLKQTHSRNFSLHLANLDYLKDETIDNSRKSPYFWGAFIYYGTTDVPEHNDNQNWAFWLLIFVFVGGVTFWFFRRKRN